MVFSHTDSGGPKHKGPIWRAYETCQIEPWWATPDQVKIFPQEAENEITRGALAPWVIRCYSDWAPGLSVPPILAATHGAA